MRLGAFPTTLHDIDRLPPAGGVVVVANHACYLDPLFVAWAVDRAGRRARFVATADVFRNRTSRWILTSLFALIPARRYRTDTRALREVLRYLAAGEIVCIFPEGERAALGSLQQPLAGTARFLAQLEYPVIPVGVSGTYDVWPRWSGRFRRLPVTVRVGRPLDFRGSDPQTLVYQSIRALIDVEPQPVHRGRIEPSRLSLVLWGCPACLDVEQWDAAQLRCGRCAAAWEWLPTGLFRDAHGREQPLADIAAPLWSAPATSALQARASGWHEPSVSGPIAPLESIGESDLSADSSGVRFDQRFIPIDTIRSITVERSDTLQVASASEMWQFRIAPPASAFRLQRALIGWRHQRGVE
jgi:1-acyl-sn-glycerol-3-phosphate acyltransferase